MQSDRRLTQRVNCSIEAEIVRMFGEALDVRIVDLSMSGCQITGDQSLELLDKRLSGAPLEFALHFGLDNCPIQAFCRMIYKRRETQNRYLMGLRWNSIAQHQHEILQRFIEQRIAIDRQSSASA